MERVHVPILVGLFALLIASCSSKDPALPRPYTVTLTGNVSLGKALAGASVGLFAADADGGIGDSITDGLTDETGAFAITYTPRNRQPGWLCVTAATWLDPISGVEQRLQDQAICRFLESVGDSADSLQINAWAELAAGLTRARVRLHSEKLPKASARAREAVHALVTCKTDPPFIMDHIPLDPTDAASSGELNAPLLSGIAHAALAHQAALISASQGLTPGVHITAATMALAYSDDLEADGILNGIGSAGAITLHGHQMKSLAMRGGPAGFAQGLKEFVLSERNATDVTFADLTALYDCIATASGPLFPEDEPSVPDTTSPVVSIVLPEANSTISGASVDVRGTAQDPAGIAKLEFAQIEGLQTARVNLDANPATIEAIFDTTGYPDGALQLKLTAVDKLSNKASVTTEAVVNNSGPSLSFEADTTLKGPVDLEFCANDAQGIESIRITNPEFLATEALPEENCVTTSIDTALLNDGELIVRVVARDNAGGETAKTYKFDVDNADPGSFEGCAFFDTPVASASVHACWLQPGGDCQPIVFEEVPKTDRHGCFSFLLPDRSGLLRVAVSGGSYLSGTFLDSAGGGFVPSVVDVSLDDQYLTGTFIYRAARPGTKLQNRSVNLATHLADVWADDRVATVSSRDDLEQLILAAYGHINAHIYRDLEHLSDVSQLYATDLVGVTSHASLTAEPNVRLALLSLGFAQCVADFAVEGNSTPRAHPTHTTLRSFVNLDGASDDGTATFDGLDADKEPVRVATRFIDNNFLRWKLATCIVGWIGQGRAGFTAAHFSQDGGFFASLASNTNEALFGRDALDYIPFDLTPITGRMSLPSHSRIGTQWTVALEAEEPLFGMMVEIDGVEVFRREDELGSEHTQVFRDDNGVCNVVKSMTVFGFDRAGNRGPLEPADFEIVCDNIAPTVSIPAGVTIYTQSPTITLAWEADPTSPRDEPLASFEVTVGGQAPLSVVGDASFTEITLPDCQAYDVEVKAIDLSGNSATAQTRIVCDATPPALEVLVPTIVNNGAISISGKATDAQAGVAHLEIETALETQRINSPGADWQRDISVPCNVTSHVTVRAVDRAANMSEQRRSVSCDDAEPSLTIKGTSYVPASSVAIQFDASVQRTTYSAGAAVSIDWESTPTFELYFNKADLGSSIPLPYLRACPFDAAVGDAPYLTPSASLAVDYRYRQADGTIRDWGAVERQGESCFSIAISYQTMSPKMLSVPADGLHYLDIRLRDLAGNGHIRTFAYHIRWSSPPIWHWSCGIDSELKGYTLNKANLHTAFEGDARPRVWSGRMHYGLDLPARSLVPDVAAMLTPFSTSIRTEISSERDEPTPSPSYDDRNCSPSQSWICAEQFRYARHERGETSCPSGRRVSPTWSYNHKRNHDEVLECSPMDCDCEHGRLEMRPPQRNRSRPPGYTAAEFILADGGSRLPGGQLQLQPDTAAIFAQRFKETSFESALGFSSHAKAELIDFSSPSDSRSRWLYELQRVPYREYAQRQVYAYGEWHPARRDLYLHRQIMEVQVKVRPPSQVTAVVRPFGNQIVVPVRLVQETLGSPRSCQQAYTYTTTRTFPQ